MTNITASKQGTIRLPQEVLNTLGWKIALDTNVLARFFIDDVDDKEAQKQQQIARKVLITQREPLCLVDGNFRVCLGKSLPDVLYV